MDHYINIEVLPDPEFKATTLMNAVYAKLHRALVAIGHGNIGVSFPEANKTPGTILRLHSGKADLEALMEYGWLKGLRDYTEVTAIKTIPGQTDYVQVKRVQPKITAARLRRAVKRNSLPESEAELMLANRSQLKKPYFRLQSLSTNQNFPLFIEQGKPQEQSVQGTFSAYGLSQGGTVPWF